MKKILASLIAVSTVAGFASASYAAGTNAPGGNTAVDSFTSDHAGSVDGTCSLNVVDGMLPANAGFVSSLTSSSNGSISTVCNTTTSTIAVVVDSSSSAPAQPNYTATFNLSSGTGAYSAVTGSTFVTTYNKTDLSNGYSNVASTMVVKAKAAVPTTQNLAAGPYTIKVKATVTP